MAQATVGFWNKNTHAVKTLVEWLISKSVRIVAVVFDSGRGDGFIVISKPISDKLRSEIVDWNYYNCLTTDLQEGFDDQVVQHAPRDDSASG